jgi:hypothetical protein
MSPLPTTPRRPLAPLAAFAATAVLVLAVVGTVGVRIAVAGGDDDAQADTPTSIVGSDQASADGVPCGTNLSTTPADTGIVSSIAAQVAAAQATGQQATFRLCGSSDPMSERAIEQLIAGRSFSTTLTARPDGCADLAVQVSPQAGGTFSSGLQTTNVSVSAGGRTIAVKITTQNGVTHASIGA